MIIRFFYKLTFTRKHTNEKSIFHFFNMIKAGERIFVGRICEFILRHFYKKCQKKTNNEIYEKEIIVSVTTIPSRINTIPFMLRSLFNQSLMPNRIILWITDKVEDKDKILEILRDEVGAGLEVRFVKDVGVHTKYYYAVLENPEAIIVTVDDDIIYPEDLVESLYNCHKNNPGCVVAARAHEITFHKDGVLPYNSWKMLAPGIDHKSNRLLATGVGGVLYPPHVLYKDWINVELFTKLCPTADDIWLKIMESLNHVPVVKLCKYSKQPFVMSNTQTIALSKTNVNEGRNDVLLRQCMQYYNINSDLFKD